MTGVNLVARVCSQSFSLIGENPSMSYFRNVGIRSIDPVLTRQGLRCKQNEHNLGIPSSMRSA